MGVATRDANGSFLPQQEILMSAVKVLSQYEAGTNRNQAAMAIFGSRVRDITALLKLNEEVFDKAREKADALYAAGLRRFAVRLYGVGQAFDDYAGRQGAFARLEAGALRDRTVRRHRRAAEHGRVLEGHARRQREERRRRDDRVLGEAAHRVHGER